MRLSVLDLTPVKSGGSAGDALRETLALARHVEPLGYTRYWLAEHHNAASLASSAPEILIGQVAAATRTLRVGAGGIMLPNHSPLRVAENFRVLSALFPGRIDLGLGRAPGTDPRTARILRRLPAGANAKTSADEVGAMVDELLAYLAPNEERPPFATTTIASPTNVEAPAIWMLGSGDAGAEVAARHGLGFVFAHHMNPDGALEALTKYRAEFRPSASLAAPTAAISIGAIAADTEDEARTLASSASLSWMRFAQGYRDLPLPSVEEALAHRYTDEEAATREARSPSAFVGSAARVRTAIEALAEETKVDEVLLLTHVHSAEARRRSYTLLAEAFGL